MASVDQDVRGAEHSSPARETVPAFLRVAVPAAPYLACLAFAAILAPYRDLVPFWDAREYAECVLNATQGPFDPLRLNCMGHPTMLYMLFVWAGQKIAPFRTEAFLAVNVLLGWLGLLSFHRIARRLLPAAERSSSLLAGLATLALALHPVFLAAAAFLNPDYGVAIFFLASMACLLEGRLAWAIVAGTFTVWSKQQGVVVYGILASLFVLLRLLSFDGPWRRALASSKRLLWLILPLATFAFYPVLKHYRLIRLPFFEADGGPGLLASALTVGSHRVFVGYLVLVFVLNVAWLPTLVAVGGGVSWLLAVRLRVFRAVRDRLAASEVSRNRFLVVLVLAAATLVLTRFETFLNARYFMPLYPLLLLCALTGVQLLAASRVVRALVLGTICLCFASSIWRTSDPVSRAVFGTFEFGDHEMLRMTSLTGECCGYGRDQLVYNLEFAQFHYLNDEIIRTLSTARSIPIVVWPDVGWHFFGAYDAATKQRTLRRDGVRRFRAVSATAVALGEFRFNEFLLLEFPNFREESLLQLFVQSYDVVSATEFDSLRYRVSAFHLRAKPGPATASRPLPGARRSGSSASRP